jgi:uncharacterized DUF497 family protein
LGREIMHDDVIYKGRYIWNRLKNEKNKQDHGIAFEEASEVFDDPFAVEEYDTANSDPEEQGSYDENIQRYIGSR